MDLVWSGRTTSGFATSIASKPRAASMSNSSSDAARTRRPRSAVCSNNSNILRVFVISPEGRSDVARGFQPLDEEALAHALRPEGARIGSFIGKSHSHQIQ